MTDEQLREIGLTYIRTPDLPHYGICLWIDDKGNGQTKYFASTADFYADIEWLTSSVAFTRKMI